MVVWLSYLIPILCASALAIFFNKRMAWWEYLVLLVVPAAVILIVSESSKNSQISAREYWGGYVTSAEYTEPWNEWIDRTCTRCVATDTAGRCTQEETYDCSYCDDHGPSWTVETTIGTFHGEDRYNIAVPRIGKAKFVDMDRSSTCPDPVNGNKYKAVFNGDSARLVPVFRTKTYENRVQAAPTLFSYREIDNSKRELYYHVTDDDEFAHQSVLSTYDFPRRADASRILRWYNARYGELFQVHAWLLVYKNKPASFGPDQEAYWKGGGKNEITAVVGLNNDNTVQWCHVFSWTPNKIPLIEIRDSILRMRTFDGKAAAELIGARGVRGFVRKHFVDFKYISVQPTQAATVGIFVFVLLFSVAWGVFSLMNVFTWSDPTGTYGKARYRRW